VAERSGDLKVNDVLGDCEERLRSAISAQQYELIEDLLADYRREVVTRLEGLETGARDSHRARVLRELARMRLLLLIDNATVRESLSQLPRFGDYLDCDS